MKLINGMLSIGVATLLIGCGGGSSSSTPITKESKSLVCEDINLNTTCDKSEIIAEVESWENYVPSKISKAVSSTDYPLLYEGKDGLKLLASKTSKEISPLSTLIYNELLYNINVNNVEDSLQYLENEFSFSQKLDDADSEKLIKRLKKLSEEEGFSYKNLNKLVSQFIKEKKFDVIKISELDSPDIEKAWSVDKNDTSLTWEPSDHDEDAVASSIKGDIAVVASKYHNTLTLVDTKNNTSVHTTFGNIEGDRFHIDAQTGASEHTMKDVEISSNQKDVYVLVTPANETLQEKDKTWGLFKTQVEGGKINHHTHASTKRVDNKNLSDITLSKDGTILGAYDKEYEVVISFDKDLNELSSEIDLSNKNFYDMLITNDNKYLLVSLMDNNVNKIVKYDLTTKMEVKSLEIPYSANIKINPDNNKLVIFKKEDNKSLFYIDINTLSVEKEINVDIVVKTATISNNKLFITNDTKNEIVAYDLLSDSPKVEFSVESKELVQTIFASDTKLFLPLHEKGEIEIVNFSKDGIAHNKLQNDLDKLSADTINHGMPFEAVLFDLQLNKSSLRGSGLPIKWSVSDNLSTNIQTSGIDIGKVTRPVSNTQNESGKLRATIEKEFRGQMISKSKEFDLTVRQEPIYLETEDKYTLGSIDGGGYVFYFANSGLKIAAQLYGKNSNGNGFKIFTINETTNKLDVTVEGQNIDTSGLVNDDVSKNIFTSGQLYDGIHSSSESAGMAMSDDKVLFVLKTPLDSDKNILANGALMTYDISTATLNSNENKAKKLGQTVLFDGVNTSALSSNKKENLLAVLVEGEFESIKSKKVFIYDISTLETPQLVNTIDNVNGKSIALSEDKNSVFILDGSTLEKYDIGSNKKIKDVISDDAFSITQSGVNTFIGDKDGNLTIYDNDLNLVSKYVTGYGRYGGRTSGEGHAFGRVEDIQVINNKIYMGNKYRGLIVLDASDLTNIKEERVYKHENYRRGFVTKDGTKAIPFYYYKREQNDIGFINLDK